MNLKIKTRREACAAGELKYFTGKLCSRGHDTYRYSRTGQCAGCTREYAKQFRNTLITRKTSIRYTVHVDDIATLNAFVDALNSARALTTPPSFNHPFAEKLNEL